VTAMRLIGLAGPARTGKDTIAQILETAGWRPMQFADPIKRMLHAGIGDDAVQDGPAKEEPIADLGVSPRELAQTLGDEWGRKTVRKTVWIRLLERRINQLCLDAAPHAPPDIVVTDVRYPNEAEWIRGIGGAVWHVRRAAAPAVRSHASEAGVGIEPGERIIRNDGTRAELIETVEPALAAIDDEVTR